MGCDPHAPVREVFIDPDQSNKSFVVDMLEMQEEKQGDPGRPRSRLAASMPILVMPLLLSTAISPRWRITRQPGRDDG